MVRHCRGHVLGAGADRRAAPGDRRGLRCARRARRPRRCAVRVSCRPPAVSRPAENRSGCPITALSVNRRSGPPAERSSGCSCATSGRTLAAVRDLATSWLWARSPAIVSVNRSVASGVHAAERRSLTSRWVLYAEPRHRDGRRETIWCRWTRAPRARIARRWRDRCRRTVARRSVSGGSFGEFAEDLLGDETLVAYAAVAGTTAADGRGRNCPYTAALLVAPGDADRDRVGVPSGACGGAGVDQRRAAPARVPLAGRRALPDADAADGHVGHGARRGSRGAGAGRPAATRSAGRGSGKRPSKAMPPARLPWASCYARGLGMPHDDAEAVRRSRAAAEQRKRPCPEPPRCHVPRRSRGSSKTTEKPSDGSVVPPSRGTPPRPEQPRRHVRAQVAG